jgi:hypothetical protein
MAVCISTIKNIQSDVADPLLQNRVHLLTSNGVKLATLSRHEDSLSASGSHKSVPQPLLSQTGRADRPWLQRLRAARHVKAQL